MDHSARPPGEGRLLNKPTVLIASAGRTGTKFLGTQLGRLVDDAFSVHEPDAIHFFDWRDDLHRVRMLGVRETVLGKFTGRGGTRNLSLRLLSGKIAFQEAGRRLAKSRVKLHQAVKQNLIIESYGTLLGLFSAAPYAYLHWKGVGVVREPTSWIRSWEGHHRTKYGKGDWVQRLGLGRLSPKHLPTDNAARFWEEMTTRERLAWYWGFSTRLLLQAQRDEDFVRVFKFENLFADTAGMIELLEFCTKFSSRTFAYRNPKSLMAQKVNQSISRGVPDWRSWNDREKYAVELFCSQGMQELGYECSNEWKDAVARGERSSPLSALAGQGSKEQS